MILDAKNQILGRFSSELAKELQKGTEIIVLNAQESIVSGEKVQLQTEYKKKFDRGQRHTGPFFPRAPERIMKRCVRGMLPKNRRGRKCLSQLKVFRSIPEQYLNEKIDSFNIEHKLRKGRYVKLGEISKHLGSKVTL